MQQSFYTSLSGASTHQKGLDTWANNIANINTSGFRSDTTEFKSLVTDFVRNGGQIKSASVNKKGFGVTYLPSRTNFSQAAIVNTDGEFDLSIKGAGFFVVGDAAGNLRYTRDGSFIKSRDGYLVNSSGYFLYGVDLEKITDNVFTPNQSDAQLNTDKVSDFKRLKVLNGTIYQPKQTTNLNLAINLNSGNKIKSIKHAYSDMLYDKSERFLYNRPLTEFINIKDGDKFQINTDTQQGIAYTYGTDFKNLDDLKKLILRNREDIRLEIDNDTIAIVNVSGNRLNVNYEGSSEGLKNALSLETDVIGKDAHLSLAPLYQRQEYETDFNGLFAKNKSQIRITKGDNIDIEVNGVTHTMVYGGHDEFKMGNKTIPKEDSFLTIGDFIDKLEKKTNLEVSMKNGRLKFKNISSTAMDINISSSDTNLISDLGLQSTSTISPGSSVSSYSFGVSTHTKVVNVFDQTGKKYNVKFHYVAQAPLESSQDEKWHVSFSLYDGNKLISDKNTYGIVKFSDTAEVSTILFNPEDNTRTEIDSFSLEFPNNEKISVNLKNDNNGKSSTNVKYLDSSIISKDINGNQQGTMDGVIISEQGKVIINFSNQQQEIYGRVGLVDFVNKNGLRKTGNNMFEESYAVSRDGIKYPASGGANIIWDKNGRISSNIGQRSLETSNVDLTKGLTQLIVMQRSFSANSKAISTSDEMVQQAINLKS